MKSFAIVFFVITMLAITFTASVFPQKKENLQHGQIFIQEKMMEVEQGFNLSRELDERGTWFSKNLSDTLYLMTTDLYEILDTITSAWLNKGKNTYAYDSLGNQTQNLHERWDGSVWLNDGIYSYAYDANGNLTEELYQTWFFGRLGNSHKYIYTYDANGKITEELHQDWGVRMWVNSVKYTYSYDAIGKMIEVLYQTWNGSTWVDSWKYTATYDSEGKQTVGLYQIGGVNSVKYTYTYDGNGNQTEELIQTWNGSVWVNHDQYIYIYDENGNQMLRFYETWNGSTWEYNDQYKTIYNANGTIIEMLHQRWNGSLWMNSTTSTYSYDENENLKEIMTKKWVDGVWENSTKHTYFWQMLITGVEEKSHTVGNFALSENYPNPFNPQTRISFSVPKESYITLKVYDLLGKEVATLAQEKKQAGEYSITWNAEGIPSGVYYYRLVAIDPSLHSGQVFIETKKMVLMR